MAKSIFLFAAKCGMIESLNEQRYLWRFDWKVSLKHKYIITTNSSLKTKAEILRASNNIWLNNTLFRLHNMLNMKT